MKRKRTILLEQWREALASVLPIAGIVFVLCFTIAVSYTHLPDAGANENRSRVDKRTQHCRFCTSKVRDLLIV